MRYPSPGASHHPLPSGEGFSFDVPDTTAQNSFMFRPFGRSRTMFTIMLLWAGIGALAQQPAVPTGSAAGRDVWADGASSSGETVSAITTTREGLPTSWIMGTVVAGKAITD